VLVPDHNLRAHCTIIFQVAVPVLSRFTLALLKLLVVSHYCDCRARVGAGLQAARQVHVFRWELQSSARLSCRLRETTEPYSSRSVMGCLHDPANFQQTSSNSRVFWTHLLEVCWTFAGSCKHSITVIAPGFAFTANVCQWCSQELGTGGPATNLSDRRLAYV